VAAPASGRAGGNSTLRLKSRLDRAERRIVKPQCECASAKITVYYADGDEAPPPHLCAKCGTSLPMIVVRYIGVESPEPCP
jgi:hypothetical protein